MKVREAIRLIENDACFSLPREAVIGSTSIRAKAGRVTIAGKPSDDLAPGTLNSILKQAGLKE
jgi:predicted RNA binding protein YcfA (HicA-like mRNA interferase family)